jgi:hypothetical protein
MNEHTGIILVELLQLAHKKSIRLKSNYVALRSSHKNRLNSISPIRTDVEIQCVSVVRQIRKDFEILLMGLIQNFPERPLHPETVILEIGKVNLQGPKKF